MAVANCGQRWSWDSPMWCGGKKINEGKENEGVDKMCYRCAWWNGNNKDYVINARKED